MKGLDEGRIAISAMAVGMAQGSLDRAVTYAKERIQFGIADRGTTKPSLSILQTWRLRSNWPVRCSNRVAAMRDAGVPFTHEAAMLKTILIRNVCPGMRPFCPDSRRQRLQPGLRSGTVPPGLQASDHWRRNFGDLQSGNQPNSTILSFRALSCDVEAAAGPR